MLSVRSTGTSRAYLSASRRSFGPVVWIRPTVPGRVVEPGQEGILEVPMGTAGVHYALDVAMTRRHPNLDRDRMV